MFNGELQGLAAKKARSPGQVPEELTDFWNFSASRHNLGRIRLQYRKGITRAVVIVKTMKQRFYIYRRGETFYLQDSRTGKQQSLETKDRKAAVRALRNIRLWMFWIHASFTQSQR